MTRRTVLTLAAASAALTGCSRTQTDQPLPAGGYALLVQNLFPGYRDMDGSATGRVIVVNTAGEIIAQSPEFDPLQPGRFCLSQGALWWASRRADFSWDSTGTHHWPCSKRDAHVWSTQPLPGGGAVLVLNVGSTEGGQYQSVVLTLSSSGPSPQQFRGLISGLGVCGRSILAFTRPEVDPPHVSLTHLSPGEGFGTTSGDSVPSDGLWGESLACSADELSTLRTTWGQDSRASETMLSRWNVLTGERRDLPLRGNGVGSPGSWRDGSFGPSRLLQNENALLWSNQWGLMSTDLASAATRTVWRDDNAFVVDALALTGHVVVRQNGRAVTIDRRRITDGALIETVSVRTLPDPSDLMVTDVAFLGPAH